MSDHHTEIFIKDGIPYVQAVMVIIRVSQTYQASRPDLVFETEAHVNPRADDHTRYQFRSVPLPELHLIDPFEIRCASIFPLYLTTPPSKFRRMDWNCNIPLSADGQVKRITYQHYFQWEPYTNFNTTDSRHEWHREWMIESARTYYMMRCIMRATGAHLVYAYGAEYDHNHYTWRRGKRSAVIPAFEAYCEKIGFACMDDPTAPIVPIPDFQPTEMLTDAIIRLELD